MSTDPFRPPEPTFLAAKAVAKLVDALKKGRSSLQDIAAAVVEVLETEAWRERKVGKDVVRFESFTEFCEAEPPRGLGEPTATIEALISHDVTAYNAFAQAIRPKPLNTVPRCRAALDATADREDKQADDDQPMSDDDDQSSRYNVTRLPVAAQRGNTKAEALRRLYRDKPEIFAKVEAGEITAHAGMVEAGFRPAPPDGLAKLKAAWKRASETERSEFTDYLREQKAI